MINASKLRKENIAEYLLYMWQIEDLIRANNLDMDKIQTTVIKPMGLTEAQNKEMTEWYESLIDMMRKEGVEKSGHLQLNKNVVIQLMDLHNALLKDPRFDQYTKEFYATLPLIVELRSKSGNDPKGEVETCFNALYGMLMMRLKGSQITPETQNAVAQISKFIALLAHYYKKDENNELKLNQD